MVYRYTSSGSALVLSQKITSCLRELMVFCEELSAELELMQLILAAMTPTMRQNFGNEHV